jgi:nucleoside-diphosphate-sugar epimerase
MKTALVTGSEGFIGRHMVAELKRRGWDVDGCDIASTPLDDALDIFASDSETYVPDLVIHAAARSPHRAAIDGQPASHVYNQMLDAALFDWAIRTCQRRVLYLSSCAVLDDEPDAYGLLKLTGERMAQQVREAGVPVTVVRPYSGYGEDQSEDFPFGAFAARARRYEDPFEVWSADAVRDWVHVDDVVNGALAVVESETDGPVSLCTGVGTSMQDLIGMMAETVGYRPTLIHRGDKPQGVMRRIGDPSWMLKYYTPRVTLEEGVKRALGG